MIIIEITDEIFHGVVREKAFELGVELRSEGFIVRDNQGRLVDVFDRVGDCKGLAGAGHAEQRLMSRAGFQPFGQLRNGLRLIASGLVGRTEIEHIFSV